MLLLLSSTFIVIAVDFPNYLFSVQVSQEKLLQYIHFNRLENRMLIDQQRKEIDQLKKEIDTHHPVKVLVRKEVGNPADYFDKTYAEYQAGFSANGLLKQLLIQSLIIF